MARGDGARSPAPRLSTALAVELAVCAALLPSLRVIEPGPWLPGGLALAALLLGVGVLVRGLRWPAPVAPLAEAVVWVCALTAVFFRDAAWFAVIPSPATVGFAADLVQQTVGEMTTGVAPLPASLPVSFFFVAATGALAIVLDYVVIATRLPLLAAVALLAVGLAPSVAVPSRFDGGQVVLLAGSILLLLWTDVRTRPGRDRRVWSGSSAGALAVGAIAVVVAFVATPLLPTPVQRVTVGGGGSIGIDASLRFGDDLRRPDPVDVLTVHSSAGGAPYLRAATLSGFDGERWRPDGGALDPVENGFEPVIADSDVSLVEVATHIEIASLRSGYLPVPFAATGIDGLEGTWGLQQDNRTVVALNADSVGQSFDVVSTRVQPSLDQIRAASARDSDVAGRYRTVPDDTPPEVAELALEVTAGAVSDYDAAAALQRWFRSSEFSYSLTAPVADDFDGAGVEAIAQFLRVREGYCVHFASSFALMARTLGMPSRIVVGYLPGTATGELVDGESVYAVTSNLLHAWPEVYFEGIGWVGFEPTNSLGAPPRFSTSGGTSATASPGAADAPTTAPSSSVAPGRTPEDIPGGAPSAAAAGDTARAWAGAGGITVIALLVLAAPGMAGAIRRRRRMRAGDAAASWVLVQETAIDLGILAPASDSPRGFGERLRAAGADPDAVAALVRAVERAAYAPPGEEAAGAAAAAAAVRASLLAAAPTARRWGALLAPRSLLVRPGTALAGGSG